MLLSNEQQTDEFVMIRVRGDDDLTQDDEKKKNGHTTQHIVCGVWPMCICLQVLHGHLFTQMNPCCQ